MRTFTFLFLSLFMFYANAQNNSTRKTTKPVSIDSIIAPPDISMFEKSQTQNNDRRPDIDRMKKRHENRELPLLKTLNTVKTENPAVPVNTDDSLALVSFYNQANGNYWNNHTGWLTDSVYKWYGLTVNADHRVTGISLPDNNIRGQYLYVLCDIPHLQIINLSKNNLWGELPESLSSLTELQELNLSKNNFWGSIPDSLGSLTNLVVLDLSFNKFNGSIPDIFENLNSLKELNLAVNSLEGALPSHLFDLSSLTSLVLSSNSFTGEIPSGIGKLNKLEYLILSSNGFTGTIPTAIKDLTSLTYLDLGSNLLSDDIPVEICDLTNLDTLDLSYNSFETIPSNINNLKKLKCLFIDNNQITGPLPSGIFELTGLTQLELDNNMFTGPIPAGIGDLTNLTYLELDNNHLSGTIPHEIGNLDKLETLDLEKNELEGPLPSDFNKLTQLTYLDISHNHFTALPDLSTLTNLESLYIYDNELDFGDLENAKIDWSGFAKYQYGYSPQADIKIDKVVSGEKITFSFTAGGSNNHIQWSKSGDPLTDGNKDHITVNTDDEGIYTCKITDDNYPDLILKTVTQYQNVTFSHGVLKRDYDALVAFYNATAGDSWQDNTNWLSDKSVKYWKGLGVKDSMVVQIILNSNNLTNSIPEETGSLKNLRYIHLMNNKLNGPIPNSIYSLKNLKELALNSNYLSGSISGSVSNLKMLTYLGLSSNYLSGHIPASIGDLVNLTQLDLYFNDLKGNIPPELGDMNDLLVLQLQYNDLTGSIPPELCDLSKLETMNLSYNKLSGDIPGSIGDISSLHKLLLNDNELTGNIPVSIGNLQDLEMLDLSQNKLSGNIPDEIGTLSNLTRLILRYNHLTGVIPGSIGNLSKLYYLYLDNNRLTGAVPATFNNLKLNNIFLNNNDLDGLCDLSSLKYTHLYISNNRLDFGDIEDANLDDLYYLDYAPQADIKAQRSENNNEITLTVNAEGTNNKYQWHNDGTELAGDTTATITIPETEDGAFYCLIKNNKYPDLVLRSVPEPSGNTDITCGVTTSEYEALKALYNSTQGDNWDDNYLWLSNEPVSYWYGITTQGAHITKIDLSLNNLKGVLPPKIKDLKYIEFLDLALNELPLLPAEIGALDSLKSLNLNFTNLNVLPDEIGQLKKLRSLSVRGNNLTALPDISGMTSLTDLGVQQNHLTFEDIEPIVAAGNVTYFYYSPQANVGQEQNIALSEGDSYTMSVSVGGEHNTYQWYKDGVPIGGATETEYSITSFTPGDAGTYTCEINNTVATALTLHSEPFNVAHIDNTYSVTFTVTDGTGPVQGAVVNLKGYTEQTANSSGIAVFSNVLPKNSIEYTVTADGYEEETGTVTVTDNDVDVNVTLKVATLINKVQTGGLKLWPNPVGSLLRIKLEEGKIEHIRISTITGRTIFERNINSKTGVLNLSALRRGVYIVTIYTKDKAFTCKIVKR